MADRLLLSVKRYVNSERFKSALGVEDELAVSFLAQGEYNLNYLLETGDKRYVFRVNTGSQMDLENQIAYEYRALKLLEHSGVTPKAYFVDDSKVEFPYGVLAMEYLPGRPLDYRSDLGAAAQVFARIHGQEFCPEEVGFLVKEPAPLTGIYREAVRLLNRYFSYHKADPLVAGLLEKFLMKAEERRKEEKSLLDDPWLRVINTEVNSHNFIVNPANGSCHLIDWEKPIYGEPAQDLSHFLIATTTMWKRDYILSREEEKFFLNTYLRCLPSCPQAKTLRERVHIFKFFNYLRAVSWCAMALTEYSEGDRPLSNPDTYEKIKAYLEPEFIEWILRQFT